MAYSTYLGGTNFDFSDIFNSGGLAIDGNGNVFIAGYTESADFPLTSGAFDTSYNEGGDIFITKINPAGTELIYSTYLGGTVEDDTVGITVDASGNAYVCGVTFSSDFPTTPGAYIGKDYGTFVVKLSPTGSSLLYSAILGGSGGGISVDTIGNAYITGYTYSSDFPTTPDAYDTSYNGNYDAFVTKINPTGTALLYSTFLGGASEIDIGFGIAVDVSGNAYITGYTYSSDFPTTLGAFDTSYNGGPDVFVTKINPTGTELIYSTYLGGSGLDYGFGIAVDSNGNAYVTGFCFVREFPTTPDAYNTETNGRYDVIITKINPTGAELVYSTYLGGGDDDFGLGIAIDGGRNAYVAGYTQSNDFPSTPYAFDPSFNNGGGDAFVTKINSTGTKLIYSTYLGGGPEDQGREIAVDESGNAYVMGVTYSSDFPTSSGAYDTSYNENGDVFITKFLFPTFTLNISTATEGTTDPAPGTYTYDEGTDAVITAMPDTGYRFISWTGDVPSGHENDNPVAITMDGDKSITANFIRQYTLTIAAGAGGTTNPAPGSHPCDSGDQVSITAVPYSGYQFSGWSGDVSGTSNPITINMNEDKSVQANFALIPSGGDEDGGDKGGGGCFIASAAYGSPLHPNVEVLRNFRDRYLMTNRLGQEFVNLYYKYSPFFSAIIAKQKILKIAVQINLMPLVILSCSMVHFGSVFTVFMLMLIFLLPICLVRSYPKYLLRHRL